MKMNNIVSEGPNEIKDMPQQPYTAKKTHSVDELVKGFIQDEVKNKNRKQGNHGDQGADSTSLQKYLSFLGYPDEAVAELIQKKSGEAPAQEPAQAEPEEETPDLTRQQQNDFRRIQQFLLGDKMTRKEVDLLMRELSR